MAIFKRIADVAHKTVVTGLFATFCYTTYTVTGQMIEGYNSRGGNGTKQEDEHPQAGFIQMLKDKAAEEYKKYYRTDHREWYDKDVSLSKESTLFSKLCSSNFSASLTIRIVVEHFMSWSNINV